MKEMLPNFDVPSSLKLDRSGKVARSNLFENYIFPIYFPILQFLSTIIKPILFHLNGAEGIWLNWNFNSKSCFQTVAAICSRDRFEG